MIALQHKASGQLICYYDSMGQAREMYPDMPECLCLVDTDKAIKLEVVYTELGGPWGYGTKSPEFTTYGPLKGVIRKLIIWMKETTRTFGPDPRDVKDFFRHCSLTVGGENKTDWILRQVENINLKNLYL